MYVRRPPPLAAARKQTHACRCCSREVLVVVVATAASLHYSALARLLASIPPRTHSLAHLSVALFPAEKLLRVLGVVIIASNCLTLTFPF